MKKLTLKELLNNEYYTVLYNKIVKESQETGRSINEQIKYNLEGLAKDFSGWSDEERIATDNILDAIEYDESSGN